MQLTSLHIDGKSTVPIWSQIEQQLQLLIGHGALPCGSAVPSVRDLARELVVNPATVSKAYQRLTEMGLLEVRRGQGTFVASTAPSQPFNQLAEEEIVRAAQRLAALARASGLALGAVRELLNNSWRALDANEPGGVEMDGISADPTRRRKTTTG